MLPGVRVPGPGNPGGSPDNRRQDKDGGDDCRTPGLRANLQTRETENRIKYHVHWEWLHA